MSISGISGPSAQWVQSLVDMRAQLGDLQRQLATGRKSESYAGLGLDRGLAVGLRSHLVAITGYGNTIDNVGVRLQMAQTALTQIDQTRQTVKNTALQSRYVPDASGQTQDQHTAVSQLDTVLGLLNVRSGDRYLFSGRAVDQPSVESTDHILNGDGVRAGLKTIIAQRRAADLGSDGLGRLVVSSPAAGSVSLAEDVAGSPFGFKLLGATTTLTGATVTGPAGAPPGVTVALGANPNAGEQVTFAVRLPDGSTDSVTLTATASSPPGAGAFAIGANATATAANLQAALGPALATLANTSLTAASAMAAGNDFFNADAANPPQRVAGPPYETATALVDGTDADTVQWYGGDAGSDPARATSVARIDQSMTVSYGMRANEPALRNTIASLAVFAATTLPPSNPDAGTAYESLKIRLVGVLDESGGQQKVSDIEADLAGAQTTLANAKDRHQQTQAAVENLLESIEGVSKEEVGAKVLALQTSLEASLQTTAMLTRMSLIDYL